MATGYNASMKINDLTVLPIQWEPDSFQADIPLHWRQMFDYVVASLRIPSYLFTSPIDGPPPMTPLAKLLLDAPADPQHRLMFADHLFDRLCNKEAEQSGGWLVVEAAACLQRILAVPGEDSYRLEYADAVEGVDAARAEFVRVQVELAAFEWRPEGEDYHRRFGCECTGCSLRRRERELLDDGWIAWCLPWRGEYCSNFDFAGSTAPFGNQSAVYFSRGFVSRVTASWADWSRYAAAIRNAQPVTQVVLTTAPEYNAYRDGDTTVGWIGHGADAPASRRHRVPTSPDPRPAILAAEWPGVAFTLPPARETTPAFRGTGLPLDIQIGHLQPYAELSPELFVPDSR